MTFYDREDELDALESAFDSPGHAFFVIYGRRRGGKTELIKEFCSERPHIYFLAAQEAKERQRESSSNGWPSTSGTVCRASTDGTRPSPILIQRENPTLSVSDECSDSMLAVLPRFNSGS